jgi:hypothetical protein
MSTGRHDRIVEPQDAARAAPLALTMSIFLRIAARGSIRSARGRAGAREQLTGGARGGHAPAGPPRGRSRASARFVPRAGIELSARSTSATLVGRRRPGQHVRVKSRRSRGPDKPYHRGLRFPSCRSRRRGGLEVALDRRTSRSSISRSDALGGLAIDSTWRPISRSPPRLRDSRPPKPRRPPQRAAEPAAPVPPGRRRRTRTRCSSRSKLCKARTAEMARRRRRRPPRRTSASFLLDRLGRRRTRPRRSASASAPEVTADQTRLREGSTAWGRCASSPARRGLLDAGIWPARDLVEAHEKAETRSSQTTLPRPVRVRGLDTASTYLTPRSRVDARRRDPLGDRGHPRPGAGKVSGSSRAPTRKKVGCCTSSRAAGTGARSRHPRSSTTTTTNRVAVINACRGIVDGALLKSSCPSSRRSSRRSGRAGVVSSSRSHSLATGLAPEQSKNPGDPRVLVCHNNPELESLPGSSSTDRSLRQVRTRNPSSSPKPTSAGSRRRTSASGSRSGSRR